VFVYNNHNNIKTIFTESNTNFIYTTYIANSIY